MHLVSFISSAYIRQVELGCLAASLQYKTKQNRFADAAFRHPDITRVHSDCFAIGYNALFPLPCHRGTSGTTRGRYQTGATSSVDYEAIARD